jgi:hypothetical protein
VWIGRRGRGAVESRRRRSRRDGGDFADPSRRRERVPRSRSSSDITASLRSVRASSWTFHGARRGPYRLRSWNSSKRTTPALEERIVPQVADEETFGEDEVRVRSETWRSKRTWKPTSPPTRQPRSLAILRAAARAASRRGSSIRIARSPASPASRRAGGTRVVLPAPVGARRTAQADFESDRTSSGRTSSIGRRSITAARARSDPP